MSSEVTFAESANKTSSRKIFAAYAASIHILETALFASRTGRMLTTKIKRGLLGFVNGSQTSAFPDTGATENVVSVAFAEERQLEIKNNPGRFRLGNSEVTQSIGNDISFAPTVSRNRVTY